MGVVRRVEKPVEVPESWPLTPEAYFSANSPGGGNMRPIVEGCINSLPPEEFFQNLMR